jgi:hypothetical protein
MRYREVPNGTLLFVVVVMFKVYLLGIDTGVLVMGLDVYLYQNGKSTYIRLIQDTYNHRNGDLRCAYICT